MATLTLLKKGTNMAEFIFDETKFDEMQTKVIKKCIEAGYNPHSFADPKYEWTKMHIAFHAMRNEIDMSPYLDKFDIDQLEEIRIGLILGLDVSFYAIPELTDDEMRHKRMSIAYNIKPILKDK